MLTVGQTAQAKIVDIDNEKQKVSLSIRALLAPAAEAEPAAAEADVVDDGPVVVYDTEHADQYEAPEADAE